MTDKMEKYVDKLKVDFKKQLDYLKSKDKKVDDSKPIASFLKVLKEAPDWKQLKPLEQTEVIILFGKHVNDVIMEEHYVPPVKAEIKPSESLASKDKLPRAKPKSGDMKVVAYCDGGCRGNGKEENIGAWGTTIYLDGIEGEFTPISGTKLNTTNNQMELSGAIETLAFIRDKGLHNSIVEINVDSAYVLKGISGDKAYIHNWKQNGFKTAKKQPVANQELWMELSELNDQFPFITWQKVKGHSDDIYNQRADDLVNFAMDNI